MSPSLLKTLAHRLDASPEDVQQAVQALTQQLRKKVARSGEVHLPGLGTFTRPAEEAPDGSPLTFEPDETLSRTVNRHYEGLDILVLSGPPQALADEESPPTDAPPPAVAPVIYPDEHEPDVPPATSASEDMPDEEAPDEQPSSLQEDEPDTAPPDGPPPVPAHDVPARDVASVESAREEEDTPEEPASPPEEQPSPPHLLVARVPYSVVPGGIFAANRTLSPAALEGATFLPMGPPEPPVPAEVPTAVPAEAPTGPPVQEVSEGPVQDAPPAHSSRRFSFIPWAAAAFVLLALVAGAWYFLSREEDPTVRLSTAPTPPADTTATEAAPAVPPADTTALAAADTAQQLPEEPALAPLGIDAAAGGYTLIVASRTSRDEAEQLVGIFRQRFADAGLPVDIFTGTAGGIQRYRVAVGRYESLDAAAQSQQQYAEQFPDAAWPMRLTPDQ